MQAFFFYESLSNQTLTKYWRQDLGFPKRCSNSSLYKFKNKYIRNANHSGFYQI